MSNHITVQYFQTLFPEFSKTPVGTLESYIEIATMRVSKVVWCNAYKYATALLAAHMLTASGIGGLGASGGSVVSEQVGDVSRSYNGVGIPGTGYQELLTTRYGTDFMALRRENVMTGMVTGTNPYLGEVIPGKYISSIASELATVLEQAIATLLNPNYHQLVDYVSSTVAYHGNAATGSLDTDAIWQIKKVVITNNIAETTYANGNANFTNIWTDRTTYPYS